MIRHLYFHIPFCASICPYCSFHVETPGRNKSRAFLEALLAETRMQARRFELQPQTIYFGGGTPSMLSQSELQFLLAGLREALDLDELQEWTFEINPATVTARKAALLRSFGVNRVSMGVQSWDDRVLKILGRTHSAAEARDSFALLRSAGFANVSVDLMFGVPTQTIGEWRASIEQSLALHPEHISAYGLTYEEDTDYFRRLEIGELSQDVETEAAMFELTMDTLSRAGFEQYEISNYARPGFASAHNAAYWTGADYLGIGPSAFSTVAGERWQNVPDSARYTAGLALGEIAITFREPVSAETHAREQLAFGLRTSSGVPREKLTGQEEQLAEFSRIGLLNAEGTRVRLSRRGRLVADAVAQAFI